jgi:hypothetical protein
VKIVAPGTIRMVRKCGGSGRAESGGRNQLSRSDIDCIKQVVAIEAYLNYLGPDEIGR